MRLACPPAVQAVIEGVCAAHALSVEEMIARDRRPRIVFVRREAIRAVVAHVRWRPEDERGCSKKWSMRRIGQIFGGRHHTTILHALEHTKKSQVRERARQ